MQKTVQGPLPSTAPLGANGQHTGHQYVGQAGGDSAVKAATEIAVNVLARLEEMHIAATKEL